MSNSNSDQDRVTFKDKYNSKKITWQEKAVLISLYHIAMCMKYPTWHMGDTAQHFEVSIGLVSENIRLAKVIDSGNKKIMECKTREDGLKLINRRHYVRERKEFILIEMNEMEEDE